jgi:DeoR/GlpR family transcriptional regulator of sugar metabolism
MDVSVRNKSGRQARMLAQLKATPAMRVHELAALFGVSAETIRRDLTELDSKGLVNRTYGGALRPIAFEPGLAEREKLMVAERERIAEAAVKRVRPNDILMIGGGATTLQFARRLSAEADHVTVITHAFSVAQAIASNATHKVLVLPGQYDGREGLIHGADTIDALQRFHAHRAFLGASGLTNEGPNDAALPAGMIYGAMMRRATETFILADHSKFDSPSLTVYGPWSPQVTLVSDRLPGEGLAAAIGEAGGKIIVA